MWIMVFTSRRRRTRCALVTGGQTGAHPICFLAAKFPKLVVEMLPLKAGKGDPKIARIKAWVALIAKKEYAVGEGLTEIFTQLMAYNMKKKSNRDDLIDSCSYGQ